jgi:hypothetical protein
VYRCMHDRRMSVEMKGGCEGYGVMPSMAEGSCGAARQVRERAEGWRLGYSGDSGGGGGGDFLARISVYKGEEGRLSEIGWIIVE